ncbi:hypothetical protein DPEC_G00214400 [Dallia pectoralis]|uniref:Uncharacterized protein n=1 Tax=Dallia pectoralis TaxID=75939 RepID=A0ACC2G265_DALPE|nr:hypothetical protein DPEC_G00214400 [Dallia pectoralis]
MSLGCILTREERRMNQANTEHDLLTHIPAHLCHTGTVEVWFGCEGSLSPAGSCEHVTLVVPTRVRNGVCNLSSSLISPSNNLPGAAHGRLFETQRRPPLTLPWSRP